MNTHLVELSSEFEKLTDSDSPENFESTFKQFCETKNLKTGNLLQPLRVAVSGEGTGAPIWEMIALLGKEEVIHRIKSASNKISFSIA
jgi:glutamyl-tRNA synthetase